MWIWLPGVFSRLSNPCSLSHSSCVRRSNLLVICGLFLCTLLCPSYSGGPELITALEMSTIHVEGKAHLPCPAGPALLDKLRVLLAFFAPKASYCCTVSLSTLASTLQSCFPTCLSPVDTAACGCLFPNAGLGISL